MTKRVVAVCVLVSLFLFLLVFSLYPRYVLEARTESGIRVLCRLIERGDDILYLSVNSIYKVPVQERLRITSDGAFAAVDVVSTPDVVYYYGIESFTPLENGMVRGVPREVRYREVRIKIGQRGQQFLVIGGERLALYEFAEAGQAVTLRVDTTQQAFACK